MKCLFLIKNKMIYHIYVHKCSVNRVIMNVCVILASNGIKLYNLKHKNGKKKR